MKTSSRIAWSLFLGLGLAVVGCDSDDGAGTGNASASQGSNDDDDEATTGDPTDPDPTDPDPTDPDPTDPDPTDPDPSDTDDPDPSDTEDPDPTGVQFITDPDGGGGTNECDIWAQDCPDGDKCMPWANDGGNSWNATTCSPVAPVPNQPGDPCSVEGSGVSGVDDCALSSMCWNVDGETNMGTCVGFCEGSENSPVCSDPNTGCSITNEGTLILCLPECDPLSQDCPEGEACYDEPNGFFCSPDASGPDLGDYGSPCEYLNACDPGLFCANAELVPDCAGSLGCCSDYCDITDATDQCNGVNQECTPFFEEGTATPGYEDVGVCILPL